MKEPPRALPDHLDKEVRTIALAFASQIVSIFERTVTDAAAACAPGKSPGASIRASTAKPGALAVPAKNAVRDVKGAGVEKLLIAALRKSPAGLGAEQINREIGTTTVQITPILQQLVASGRITKTGKARGTKYLVR